MSVKKRTAREGNRSFEKKLEQLRRKIDRADQQLLRALALRLETVERIGTLKRENGVPVLQKARWSEVMKKRMKVAQALGIKADFTSRIYRLIHQEALRIQRKGK